ncbi:hypothetical protein EsDP_00007448 [Epichloe bromicola]|uniref:Fungal-type protein kinase domain-containing protein n=1 Tax=Epichloe bromicola TaxID=79588 RepID=A0ABQ0D0L4_9HYPO
MDQARLKIIEDNPIGQGLDAFRTIFDAICQRRSIPKLNALQQLTSEALQGLPVARLLRSSGSGRYLLDDMVRLYGVAVRDDFDLDHIKPVLHAVLTENTNDALIWTQVYAAVTESTPPPRMIVTSLQQTPWLHNTASFANSSEYRKDVDRVLKAELGTLYVGLPRFHETFFGAVPGLERASEAVVKKCVEGDNALFDKGWRGWPEDANQDRVLSWFSGISERLWDLANEYKPTTALQRRRTLAQPNKPIQGSTAERKLDVGFVNDPDANMYSRYHWSSIYVPGEIKSNALTDIASKAWLDLGRYGREVLAAQFNRRFVLGFTLCGSIMRLWEFDRLGGIASKSFNINEDPKQFVSAILGFLWLSDEGLGFDPTIVSSEGKQYIEIERNGKLERLIIDQQMRRAPCVAGRATTCWRAHREGDNTPLVIKDSWQYPEREEEGKLLQEATAKGVVNVARYYHHETVRVRGRDDDIYNNIRACMDIRDAENYRMGKSMASPTNSTTASAQRMGQSTSVTKRKRSSNCTDPSLSPGKRPCSTSPIKPQTTEVPNRVHRRIVLRDFGKAIYKASSQASLLAALDGCIEGHESLRMKASILQRDISINNLLINEDDENPSWRSFLIDLDLAIKEQRQGASGAREMTGTRAFMAIGVLMGEQHSFMHDLESFFWVLFWICIHYDGPNHSRVVEKFDQWNYLDVATLANQKKGQIDDEADFIQATKDNFTQYYQPLIPWVNKLRRVVFPNGGRWKTEDESLYTKMKKILREAQEDPEV